ncbi:unnamed protein product [Rhizophagus irregularis]|uniref:Uncharacterized protein n=1 Tax=Rhizophagus irregularis TaxID=588596 RepID=A0A915ZQ31_9GLOM|nr:unnamed protein product [Rhizophagus irregularis]CAB5386634.1 unnamed protein product [Rhizophagus irregularis]
MAHTGDGLQALNLQIFNRRRHTQVPALDLRIFNGRRHIWVPVLWHFGSSVRRSWFFLRQLRRFGIQFHISVLRSQFFLRYFGTLAFQFHTQKKEKEND